MKRALSLLLLVIALVYAKQGYDIYQLNQQATASLKGTLSDIAEEVVAIPLKTTGGASIQCARYIRQEGNNLFLISNDVLYRFTSEGEFVCRITDPEEIRVAGYVLHQANHELIVLGNKDDIYYYTYDGKLKDQKKLKSNFASHRMQSLALINNRILTVEEDARTDEDTMQTIIRRRVVTYDTSFHKLSEQTLQPVQVGRNRLTVGAGVTQLCVHSDTGQVYAYMPDMSSDHILRDTLFLMGTYRWQFGSGEGESIALAPVLSGGRFWIASQANRSETAENYTFCYDTQKRSYCEVKGGLCDDFYHTGRVADLEAMDASNQTYAFCRSGEAIKKAFPKRKADDNTVVFILKLKA